MSKYDAEGYPITGSDKMSKEDKILSQLQIYMATLNPKQVKRFKDKLTDLVNNYLGIPF